MQEAIKNMKFQKKVSLGAPFAKKGTDIKEGDIITLTSDGKIVEGQFGPQNIFEIKNVDGAEFVLSINQTSMNALIDVFGEESANWVGKRVKVHVAKQNVAGKFIPVYYVAPEGYELGENGFEKSESLGVSNAQTYEESVNMTDSPY